MNHNDPVSTPSGDTPPRIAETDQRLTDVQLIEAMFEASPDLICVADFGGFFIRTNSACSRILGWSTEEFLARPFMDFIHPEDRVETAGEYVEIRAEERGALKFENRYQAKDGGYKWIQWNTITLPDRGWIVCNGRDVTEERKQAEELRRTSALLSGVIENNMALIYVKDLEGRYLLYNEQFSKAFALEERAASEGKLGSTVLLGRDDTWLDPDLQPTWRENDLRAQQERYHITEWSDHPTLGRLFYESIKFPLKDEAGNTYATCGVSLDVTAQERPRNGGKQIPPDTSEG